MQKISDFFPQLATPKTIAITMHQKPDGDAMGSTLGLYHFFTSIGHTAQVISPTNWADFLNWMPGVNSVIDFEQQTSEAKNWVQQAEFVFCLDFNTLPRTKNLAPILTAAIGKLILIDHHQQPEETAFVYGISDTSKSSTCEMVYDFIQASGYANSMNIDCATCLYTGIMTDTGSFRFPSTKASVHRAVAHFKEMGLDHTSIHSHIFDSNKENKLRFLGHVLLNRMYVKPEMHTAYICIPNADLMRYHIKTGDTEGLVNYLLSMQGIIFGAIVIDREGERKWSFRSKGNFDVNTFARKHFEGGGHFNAAGGRSSDSLEQTVKKFKEVITAYEQDLQ